MALKRLGNSDMEITSLGLGAWAIGGTGYAFSWGTQDDKDSVAALRHGLRRGINWIDTAAVYGLGHSEEIVADAIEGLPEKPYIFSKCERVWDETGKVSGSLNASSIRGECEDSLRRLKVDAIDLYQIHWPDPEEDIEEGWAEMAKLKDEGKIRWMGVSNFNVEQMDRAHKIAPITSLQPPYNLLRRDIEAEILPYCMKNNIGVIVYSPMASGLLTGKMTKERAANFPEDDWRSRNPAFKEPQLSKNLEVANKLGQVASRTGHSAGEAALAWTLNNAAVTAAIVGVRSPEQVDGIIGALDYRLSSDDLRTVET